MKEIISSGKTLDDATDKGLALLGARREEVEVEPLSAGSKGFLGFGRKPAQVRVVLRSDERIRTTVFLRNILRLMDIVTTSQVREEDEKILITLGTEASSLIGSHGNTLDALQYLMARYLNEDKDEWRKVVIDVDNYRDRREDSLKDMALKMAEQVARTRRDVKTEPLTAPERRVIHMTLKENTSVTTFSIGEGSRKRVVIATTEKSSDSRRRPPRRRGGGRSNGARPESGSRSEGSSRPPRSAARSDESRSSGSGRPPRSGGSGGGGAPGGSGGAPGGGGSGRPRRRRPPRSRSNRPANPGEGGE